MLLNAVIWGVRNCSLITFWLESLPIECAIAAEAVPQSRQRPVLGVKPNVRPVHAQMNSTARP